eukprot:11476-Amphidinium_carterae.2
MSLLLLGPGSPRLKPFTHQQPSLSICEQGGSDWESREQQLSLSQNAAAAASSSRRVLIHAAPPTSNYSGHSSSLLLSSSADAV